MGIFSDKLRGTPLAYANAYLLLQRIKSCEWGDPATSEERMRAAYAAEALRDIAAVHDVIRFYLDHYVLVGTPGVGQGDHDDPNTAADARHPPEDGRDHLLCDTHDAGVAPSSPSGAARQRSSGTHSAHARGTGAPTAAERAGARRAAASQAADVFEFRLRDGVKLGDVCFEDMNSIAEGSLFEATLMAMLRKEFPDAYGPVRKTVSVGALERMKLLAAKQAKRNAPSLIED